MADEGQIIDRIARAIPSCVGRHGRRAGTRLSRNLGIELGIGDDAMVMRGRAGREWVVTVDAFVEGVHFWADKHPPDAVGYKALARATSDLAAMGAVPRFFLMTLALPNARTDAWLDAMLHGMGRAARRLGLTLAGGDTTQSAAVSISLTVVGEARRGQVVTRAGAKPGDLIYVSGVLGRAELGLELVRRGMAHGAAGRRLAKAHFYPEIRLELGEWLAQSGIASAMMDLSDGLSSDLARLCKASRVRARVYAERMPLVAIPERLAKRLGKHADALQMALHGGDDYELLFTVPAKMIGKLRGAPRFSSLHPIGEIQYGSGIALVDANGEARTLTPAGWDPFRKKQT